MRVVDVVLAFPFYVLIIALVFVVGVGTHGIYIAFGLTDWVIYARTTRSGTMVARNLDWVAAAEGGGLSRPRVLWRHILPNTITQAIVYSMSDIVHRDPGRRHSRLPRARDPAAGAGLGLDDLRRSELPPERPVDGHLPWPRGRCSQASGCRCSATGSRTYCGPNDSLVGGRGPGGRDAPASECRFAP